MADRPEKKDMQVLVSAVWPSLLPLASELRRHFDQHWGDFSVESTKDGHLVTFKGRDNYGDIASSLGQWLPIMTTQHTVAGHHVQMNLVVPDVYGCQVTVTPGRVEVNVGRDAIDRIICDELWRDRLLLKSTFRDVCVHYTGIGHIAVTQLLPVFDLCTWEWEFHVVSILIDVLRPFRAAFPRVPCCLRDRCLDRCSSRPVQDLSSSDSQHCQTDAVINLGKIHRVIVCIDTFLQKMHTAYPRLQFTCRAEQNTLTLKGNDHTVQKAAEDTLRFIRKLARTHIRLTHTQAMMMRNPAAQHLLQQSLDNKGVQCAWKLESMEVPPAPTRRIRKRARLDAADTIISRPVRLGRSLPKEPASVVSVIAPETSIRTFEETLQSCFQTTDVVPDKSQVPDTQSDSWKQFLDNLQNSRESTIVPVVEVEQDQVTICDLTSDIDTTRRAVLDFFHKLRNDQHKEFSEQNTTETITTVQPWQMKFLSTAQNKTHLPSGLQQSVSVNSEEKSVLINAPVHLKDKYVGIFWKYLADLSQRRIALTAASAHRLQKSDIRERVQSLLDKEGVVCDWHVQQGTLVISAHHSDLQRVEHIFMTEIETVQLDRVSPVSQQTEDWRTERTDHPAEHSPLSSPSVILEQQVGTSQESIPDISSRTPYSAPSSGRQDGHNPVTQQPGCSRGPLTRAAPAPRDLADHTESGMNNIVHVPLADVSADRPSEGGKSLENRPQQSTDVVETPHDGLASLTTQEDHPRLRHSSQPSPTTPTVTTTNTNSDSSIIQQLQLQLNSAILARLSHLEQKVSLMDRERVHEPPVPLETRIINMQHQLDHMMQRQDYSRRQQNDTDSDVTVIGNPSAADTASIFPLMMSQQEQREQQQRQHQQQPQRQQQQQPQQQHQQLPRQPQWQRQQNNGHSDVMMICNPSETDSVSTVSSLMRSEQQ